MIAFIRTLFVVMAFVDFGPFLKSLKRPLYIHRFLNGDMRKILSFWLSGKVSNKLTLVPGQDEDSTDIREPFTKTDYLNHRIVYYKHYYLVMAQVF